MIKVMVIIITFMVPREHAENSYTLTYYRAPDSIIDENMQ